MELQHLFLNKSQLGAFGEFAYKNFCNAQGFNIERTNFCHTDYFIKSRDEHFSCYVDVKTSQNNRGKYSGKRYHEEIVYESIIVLATEVIFIPDANSPFRDKGQIKLGDLPTLINEWKKNTDSARKTNNRIDGQLLNDLQTLFAKSEYPRIRFVERGSASGTRWTGTVDNLPGTQRSINNADVTIFIEYRCENFQENISRILLIPHNLIIANKIKMLPPNKRQKNKGIERVIDIPAFASDYPEKIFTTIKSLSTFLLKGST